LIEAGRLVWERGGEQVFTVGSQGLEAALAAYWRASGLLPEKKPASLVGSVDRIACVSGSVSPVTASQIAYSVSHGYTGIRIDATKAVDEPAWENEIGHVSRDALRVLSEGSNPLVFTAAGPDDPAVAALRQAVAPTPPIPPGTGWRSRSRAVRSAGTISSAPYAMGPRNKLE
jgi:uncharacterized protein YgbK (DUF1537 family)